MTVTLTGRGTSPDRPVVDQAGTFNYAIDQGHEFYPGLMPSGPHEVVVPSPGGGEARASFRVEIPRPPRGPRHLPGKPAAYQASPPPTR